jgi:hypothetical protein
VHRNTRTVYAKWYNYEGEQNILYSGYHMIERHLSNAKPAWSKASVAYGVQRLVVVAALFIVPTQANTQSEPLPRRTDIPADFSTVTCPGEPQARRMLQEFHVAGEPWFNTSLFMKGLATTGCKQLSGPLEIREVLKRKRVVDTETGDYIFYRAVRPNGETVFGVVHEAGNNRHGRTPEEKWVNNYTTNGNVTANSDKKRTFVCPTPEAAMKVVAAIPSLREKERGTKQSRQTVARDKALIANTCTMADGVYKVTKVHTRVFISLGYEAGEEWAALTGVDPKGQTVGLLYDTSQY